MEAVSKSGGATETDEDLEAAMEDFLRKQAEKESGELSIYVSLACWTSMHWETTTKVGMFAGNLLAQPATPVTEVVGSDVVTDEVSAEYLRPVLRVFLFIGKSRTHFWVHLQEAKRYCREVVRVIKELKETRDMSVAEVKLTLAIEDVSVREQKEYMGIEVCFATLLPSSAFTAPLRIQYCTA